MIFTMNIAICRAIFQLFPLWKGFFLSSKNYVARLCVFGFTV